MKIKVLHRRVLLLVVFFLFCAASTVTGQVKIADLKNPNVVMGCSCGFQSASEAKKPDSQKFLFLSELGTGEGWMNINGKDTKLKLVKTTQNQNGESRVGTRFYEEYSSSGLKVRIDYVTTWVCPPRDEACEATNYNVTFTVTKGKASKTVKATGTCGC